MSNRRNRADIENAIAELRKRVSPGDTVYTVLKHVSGSGMSRSIALYVFNVVGATSLKPGKASPSWLTRWVHNADIGNGWDERRDAVKVGGCGMDTGFHLVYSLGRALFPEGFGYTEVGIRPLDGKRVNINIGRGSGAGPLRREEYAEHYAKGWRFPGGRNGNDTGWDDDGGYALKHEWL